jgi:hypothetical protein
VDYDHYFLSRLHPKIFSLFVSFVAAANDKDLKIAMLRLFTQGVSKSEGGRASNVPNEVRKIQRFCHDFAMETVKGKGYTEGCLSWVMERSEK